jgi:hypothetical protein
MTSAGGGGQSVVFEPVRAQGRRVERGGLGEGMGGLWAYATLCERLRINRRRQEFWAETDSARHPVEGVRRPKYVRERVADEEPAAVGRRN